VTIAPELTYIT